MTVKSNGLGGFTASNGRGKAKVSITIDAREITSWIRANKRAMPKLAKKAQGRAATALQSQLRAVMRKGGGVNGVAKFRDYEDFTKALRDVSGRSSVPMGGALADKGNIVKYIAFKKQYIGWPDKLGDVALNFQDGAGSSHADAMFADPDMRRYFHRLGVENVPSEYVHNKRDVLNQFGAHIGTNLKPWKEGALKKMIATELAKKRMAS